MYSIAKVANRSGIRIFTTNSALIKPTRTARTIGTANVATAPCSYQTIIDAETTVVKETVEPTDRSNPPTIKENVTPTATNVTMEMERKISVMLA